jgi:hypothetical protein
VTGVSAAFMERNSWDRLPLTSWSRIADYARYPQGPPPVLAPAKYPPPSETKPSGDVEP